MIDRSIRSLFPEWMRHDVHVVATVMSVDQKNPANILGINGASLALAISDIPWNGPIGAVRIGCIDGKLVVNPDEKDLPNSTLDLTVAGHRGGITMVEAGAKEVSEELLVDAMELANEAIGKIMDFIDEVVAEIGKPKAQLPAPEVIEEIDNWMRDNLTDEIYAAVQINQKQPRGAAIAAAQQKAEDFFAESYPDSAKYIATIMDEMVKKAVRRLLLVDKKRADGRAMDELRPITCEVDILPMTHGSALFTRGETQSLGVTVRKAYRVALQCAGGAAAAVVEYSVPHLVCEVQAPAVVFQLFHHANALLVVGKTALVLHEIIQHFLSCMAEGSMAKVMAQSYGFG